MAGGAYGCAIDAVLGNVEAVTGAETVMAPRIPAG
jgi:hypothetical protein